MSRFVMVCSMLMVLGNPFAKAQENFTSMGTVFSLPIGSFDDYYNFGVGINTRFESGITEKIAAGFGFEILYFNPISYETDYGSRKSNATLAMPAKVNFRYSFMEQRKGPYASVNMGLYAIYRFPKNASSIAGGGTSLHFGWGQEVGMFITEQAGVALACDLFYSDSYFSAKKEKSTSMYLSLRTFVSF